MFIEMLPVSVKNDNFPNILDMTKGILIIIMLILCHWVQSQSISVITSTGYTNSDCFRRPISFGLEYSQRFKKIVLNTEIQFANVRESYARMKVMDMLWMYSYYSDLYVKAQIFSLNINPLFYIKKNDNVSLLIGPTIGAGIYNGTEKKTYYPDMSLNSVILERKLDKKIKPTIGVQFRTEINQFLNDRLSLVLIFAPKWMYLHNVEYYDQVAIIPRSYIWTSFGIGLKYDFK